MLSGVCFILSADVCIYYRFIDRFKQHETFYRDVVQGGPRQADIHSVLGGSVSYFTLP